MNYEIIKLSAQEISPEIINKLSFWANPILLESCPLYKFLYAFKVVKLFLKHPVYIYI